MYERDKMMVEIARAFPDYSMQEIKIRMNRQARRFGVPDGKFVYYPETWGWALYVTYRIKPSQVTQALAWHSVNNEYSVKGNGND